MSTLSLRGLILIATYTVVVLGEQLFLDFDDISIPNDSACGNTKLPLFDGIWDIGYYHGLDVTSLFSSSALILNTTKTEACSSETDEAQTMPDHLRISPFGLATSGTNVAFSGTYMVIALHNAATERLVNNASFDVGPLWRTTQDMMAQRNVTIQIQTVMGDFGLVELDHRNTFTFHTADDGLGPYHIVVPNSDPYIYLQIDWRVDNADLDTCCAGISVDSVALEKTPISDPPA